MHFKSPTLLIVSLSVNLLCMGVVATQVIHQKLVSDGAITARSRGLRTVAQHYKSQTCWTDSSSKPFKIGDEITTKGSYSGRIPTGCIIAPNTNQLLQVAYLDGVLKVAQVYSQQELVNQISTMKEDKKDGDSKPR